MYVVTADLAIHRVWYKYKYPEGCIMQETPSQALVTRLQKIALNVQGLDARFAVPSVQLLFILDSRNVFRYVGTQTPSVSTRAVSGLGLHQDSISMRSLSGSVLRHKPPLRPSSGLHLKGRNTPNILSSRLLVTPQKPCKSIPASTPVMVDQEAQAGDFSEVLQAVHRTIKVNPPKHMPGSGWMGSLLARPQLLKQVRMSLDTRRMRMSPPLRASLRSMRTQRRL